jgi:hypothetical protein
MNSYTPPSPPSTQYETPVEHLRSWLTERGVLPNQVRQLQEKYNRYSEDLDQELGFLTFLKNFMTRKKVDLTKQADVKKFESEIRTERASLCEHSKHAVRKITLDALRLLPSEMHLEFLAFINSNSLFSRYKFTTTVLPWLIQNNAKSSKRKRTDILEDELLGTEPKKLQAKKPRRSNRIARRKRREH